MQKILFLSALVSGFSIADEPKVYVDVSLYANYMQYFTNLDAIEVGVGFRF